MDARVICSCVRGSAMKLVGARAWKMRGNGNLQGVCLGNGIWKSWCLSGWASCFQIKVSAGMLQMVPAETRLTVLLIRLQKVGKWIIQSYYSVHFVCTLFPAIGVGVGIGIGFRLGEGRKKNRKANSCGTFPNSFDTDPDSDTDPDKTNYPGNSGLLSKWF